jgi:hypothetical protein
VISFVEIKRLVERSEFFLLRLFSHHREKSPEDIFFSELADANES